MEGIQVEIHVFRYFDIDIVRLVAPIIYIGIESGIDSALAPGPFLNIHGDE